MGDKIKVIKSLLLLSEILVHLKNNFPDRF